MIFAGGAQPGGTVGIVPICAPTVTSPLAAWATLGGAGAAAGVAPLLEHAVATSEKAANSAGRFAFRLAQGGLPTAARHSMRPITVWSAVARQLLVATRGQSRLLLALPGSRRKCSPETTAKTDLLSASMR